MEKNTFFVIEQKEKTTGKYFSIALKVHNSNNLLSYFSRYTYKGFEIISINACDSWKQAQEIAAFWNDGARKNGLYAMA